jgi:hypothetical protein
MANSGSTNEGSVPNFGLDDWVESPICSAAFGGQMASQSSVELNNFNIFGQLIPTAIDGQYQLPAFPPFDPFLGTEMDRAPYRDFENENFNLSQPVDGFYTNDLEQPGFLQHHCETQYQSESTAHGHSGFNDLATSLFNAPFSHETIGTHGAMGISPYAQNFQSPGSSDTPLTTEDSPAQRVCPNGKVELASLSTSDRPSEQGLVLAEYSQSMVSLFFFLLTR